MKIILLSDVHIGLYSDSKIFHDVTINLFKEIVDTCERENIDHIFILGDYFHNRKNLNTKSMDAALQVADIISTKNTVILVGNHDAYYKTNLIPNSLQIFKHHPNITIIDKITQMEEFVLCPWGELPRGFHGGYCLGHFELNGFHMNSGYICNKGEDPKELIYNDFDHIYSGHFHMPSTQGNITYLGAPFQHNFSDVGQSRGYYIFDDGIVKFREFTNSPKFVKIHINDPKQELGEEIEGNVVRLIFKKDFGTVINEGIINDVQRLKPLKMVNDFSNIKDEEVSEVGDTSIDLMDHSGIIEDFIEKHKVPENVNKKTLIKMLMNFKKEIEDE